MTDLPNSLAEAQRLIEAGELSTVLGVLGELADEVYAVSYTHLTLPTILLV